MKSWAVTKGPSLTVGEKRLAVRTEDHPIEYFDFEGNIPKGEYGAGSMIDWDRGRWEPESDPQKGLAKGHLAFTLDGTRLKGRWHLVRTRPRSGDKTEPWLLIKSGDEFGRDRDDREITDEEATSHISGRTNEELAVTGEIRKDHAARVGVAGVVEIHPWGSTIDYLEQPDRLIFDLDPGENVPWEVLIDAAYDVRDRLATLGLQSFVKTSGGKGLHIAYSTGSRLGRS